MNYEIKHNINLSVNDISKLLVKCDERFLMPHWSKEKLASYCEKISKCAITDVIVINNDYVAVNSYYINYEDQFAYITIIAVDSSYRSMGLGKILLNKMLEYLTKDIKCIRLEVRANNDKAIHFYTSWGFAIVNTMNSSYIMEKTLKYS